MIGTGSRYRPGDAHAAIVAGPTVARSCVDGIDASGSHEVTRDVGSGLYGTRLVARLRRGERWLVGAVRAPRTGHLQYRRA